MNRPILTAFLACGLTAGGLAATVTPAAQAAGPLPTTTVVGASASTAVLGTSVTVTARVQILGLDGLLVTPTGSVNFTVTNSAGTVALGAASLPANCLHLVTPCTARLSTTALPLGNDSITGYYSGDPLSGTSSGTAGVLVTATPPGAPSLTATAQIGSIQLSWTVPADGGSAITGYNVYRGTSANGESPTAIATGLPNPAYQDTTVLIGTPYYYQVTAVNAVGESARSNEASATATSAPGPNSFNIQSCGGAGNPCQANKVGATDSNGLVTNLTLTTNSTQSQTITESVGGPNTNGCSVPGGGLSATFNDTATDNGKTVAWVVHGQEAVNVSSDYATTNGFEGCLGLGQPWMQTVGTPAPYNAADGLYEAAPIFCANDGAFETFHGSGVFTNPCVNSIDGSALPNNNYYEIDYVLPPGDGRIGGGR